MSPLLMRAMSQPLIEAALDQPRPTPQLVTALNRVLFAVQHPASLKPDTMLRELVPNKTNGRTS